MPPMDLTLFFLQVIPRIERNEDLGVISVLAFLVSVLLFAIGYLYKTHKAEIKAKEDSYKLALKEKEDKIDAVLEKSERNVQKFTDSADRMIEQYYKLVLEVKNANH